MWNKGETITDSKLFQLMGEGNRLAFDELFNRHWDRLYIAAYNLLNDRQASEDAVQEVFIDLWSRRGTVQVDNVGGYLFRAVRFQAAKHIRRAKFTSEHEEVLEDLLFVNNTEQLLDYQELRVTIESSLAKLSNKCREVFVLSRYDHLSNKEIADRMGISIRTVEKHISNAIRHLRTAVINASALLFAVLHWLLQD